MLLVIPLYVSWCANLEWLVDFKRDSFAFSFVITAAIVKSQEMKVGQSWGSLLSQWCTQRIDDFFLLLILCKDLKHRTPSYQSSGLVFIVL